MKGTIKVLDHTGHTETAFDTDVERRTGDGPLPQDEADRKFNELVASGHFMVGIREKERVQLKKFDPTYPEIIASPQLVGG